MWPFLNFSNRAGEEENAETDLESILSKLARSVDIWLAEEVGGQTDDGTSTIENMRCAPSLVS